MFTGIIKDVGTIRHVEQDGGGRLIEMTSHLAGDVRVDDSVSVNGVCQTVIEQNEETVAVTAIEETLRKTTLGELKVGDPVNLELAMKAGARFNGHFVQGHVDTTGVIEFVEKEETNWLFTIRFPPNYARYLIPVGSITVDGISLTVAKLEEEALTVAIIPHTLQNTQVRSVWKSGARVNLEFDMIGKYVARQMEELDRNITT